MPLLEARKAAGKWRIPGNPFIGKRKVKDAARAAPDGTLHLESTAVKAVLKDHGRAMADLAPVQTEAKGTRASVGSRVSWDMGSGLGRVSSAIRAKRIPQRPL